MNFKRIQYLLFFIIVFTQSTFGQNSEVHDHDHHGHKHHKNEIGIANSPVYFAKEKTLAYGTHVHYIRKIANTKFGVGLGFERIFDEHKHNTFGVVGSYRPIDGLSFNASPGITFEDHQSHPHFALHLETAYEFEVGDFHIGPAFEFAYDKEDNHISLGLHLGYGF